MKKSFFIAVMLITAGALHAQNKLYYRDYIGNRQYSAARDTFPNNLIADDYGPRDLIDDDNRWHGGIDFNGPGKDLDDLILAPEAGTIANINRIHKQKIRYVLLDAGDHRYAFVHMFGENSFPIWYNDSTIHLTYMDGQDNKLKYAIFINDNGVLKGIGQVTGKAEYKGVLKDVSNVISQYDALGPIGGSTGYPPHMHLSTLADDKDQISDTHNKNALEYIDYIPPRYDIYMGSRDDQNEVVIRYPGTQPTALRIRPWLRGEAAGTKRYSSIYDVNKVEFMIQVSGDPSYKQIEGVKSYGEINLGGFLDTRLRNHKKGLENYGSWTQTGIRPYTYGSSTSTQQPYDDFYFVDFYAAIHKSHKPGQKAKFAEIGSEAKYPDGHCQFNAHVTNMRNLYQDIIAKHVVIDNKLPAVKKVVVKKSISLGGPTPAGGNNELYIASTIYTDPDLSVMGDARAIITKEVTQGCWIGNGPLDIRVETTEPMKWMKCSIPELGLNNLSGTSSGDSTFWRFVTGGSYALSEGIDYHLVFKGKDGNDNDLINMKYFASSLAGDKYVSAIPYRTADNNTVPHWSPNPTGNQIGEESLHSFRITSGCSNPPALAGEESSRGEKGICPVCLNNSQFVISQSKVQGGALVTLSYPTSGINGINIIWKNSNGIVIGSGTQNILIPGEYTIEIRYNECCEIVKRFIVDGCKPLIDNLNIPDCLPEAPPIEVSIDLADGVVPAAITWSVPGNETTVMIPDFGRHFVAVSDAYGCETRLEFELAAPVITAGVQVAATEICGESESVVTLTLPAVIDTVAGWSWNVLDVGAGDLLYDENIVSPQFTLSHAGEYKVVFYAPGECPYEKAFTVPEVNTHVMLKDYNNLSYCNPSNPSQNSNDGMIEIMVDDPSAIVQTVWTGPDMNPGANEIDFRKENLKQGDYLVIVIFGENCSSSVYVRIGCCDGPGIPQGVGCTPEITPITEPGGLGSIVLSCGSGGEQQLFYKWDGDEGFHPNNTFRYNLPAGTYCVTITDGCMEKVFCYDIVECYLNPVIISGNVTPTCPGYSAGAIGVSAGGGTAPYKYQWSTGSVQPMLELLAKGRYCVTVTDKNFCRAVQCYDIEEKAVTTRDECNIKCNDKTVASYYPLKEVYHPDNCRKKDILCQDNYPVQLDVLAGTYIYVEEYTNTCLLQERCYNNVAVGAAYVVPKDTVPSPDGSCNWVVKCATETLRVIPGTPQPNYRERGVDAANKCVYAFKEYRCSLGDLYWSANTESTLRSNFVCPAPIGYTCIDDNGNSWKITESNQDDYCWQYFYEGADTIPFHSECQNAGDPLKDCTTIPGWETLHHGGSGYRSAAGSYSTPDYLNTKGDIRIYPNPATGIVLISTSDFGNEIQSVDVLDQNGRRLRSEHIDGSRIIADTYELKIDYPPGLYIIVVMRKNGEIVPVKVIKI